MSQFKNLYDTNNKLNALPLAQQTGSQQQTDYNNAVPEKKRSTFDPPKKIHIFFKICIHLYLIN